MSKEQLQARLADAQADLDAARKARATFDRQADQYRALSCEDGLHHSTRAGYINNAVACRLQAAGMEREVADCLSRVYMLEALIADVDAVKAAGVELSQETVAAADEMAGVAA
jgi:uncharacterized protein involved in exopolysaccharide biosynthesis